MNAVETHIVQDLIDGNARVGLDGNIWYPSGPATGVSIASIGLGLVKYLKEAENALKASKQDFDALSGDALSIETARAHLEAERDYLAARLEDTGMAPCHEGDCPVKHLENTPRDQDGAPISRCTTAPRLCWAELARIKILEQFAETTYSE